MALSLGLPTVDLPAAKQNKRLDITSSPHVPSSSSHPSHNNNKATRHPQPFKLLQLDPHHLATCSLESHQTSLNLIYKSVSCASILCVSKLRDRVMARRRWIDIRPHFSHLAFAALHIACASLISLCYACAKYVRRVVAALSQHGFSTASRHAPALFSAQHLLAYILTTFSAPPKQWPEKLALPLVSCSQDFLRNGPIYARILTHHRQLQAPCLPSRGARRSQANCQEVEGQHCCKESA